MLCLLLLPLFDQTVAQSRLVVQKAGADKSIVAGKILFEYRGAVQFMEIQAGKLPNDQPFEIALLEIELEDAPWKKYAWITQRQQAEDTLSLSLSRLFYQPALLKINPGNDPSIFNNWVWKNELALDEKELDSKLLYSNIKIGQGVRIKMPRSTGKKIRKTFPETTSNMLQKRYELFRIDLGNLEANRPKQHQHEGIFAALLDWAQAKIRAANLIKRLKENDPPPLALEQYSEHLAPSLTRFELIKSLQPLYLVNGRITALDSVYAQAIADEKVLWVKQMLAAERAEIKARYQTEHTVQIWLDNLLENDSSQILPPKGEYLLLDLWATWCKPCIKSFPKVSELVNGLEKITLVGINVESSKTPGIRFLQENNWISWPQHIDYNNEKLQDLLGVVGYPWYALIDSEGHIVHKALPHNIKELEQTLKAAQHGKD